METITTNFTRRLKKIIRSRDWFSTPLSFDKYDIFFIFCIYKFIDEVFVLAYDRFTLFNSLPQFIDLIL